MSNSIRISQLDLFDQISPQDFVALVDSSSLTTYRTDVSAFLNLVAASGSVISASWSTSSISSSYLNGVATASLFGTSSNSVSSSYATYASHSLDSISSSYALSSSWSNISISASFSQNSLTSSWSNFSITSTSASFASSSISSSYSSQSLSSSYSNSASVSISSSFAVTASFASSTGGPSFGFTFLDTPVFVATTPIWEEGNGFYKQTGWNGPSASVASTVIISNYQSEVSYSFDTSQAGVPVSAKAVILDAAIGSSWPDSQYNYPSYITIRKTQTSVDLLLIGVTSFNPGNAGENCASQGIFPLNTDRTFFWKKFGTGGNFGWNIRLIGYISF